MAGVRASRLEVCWSALLIYRCFAQSRPQMPLVFLPYWVFPSSDGVVFDAVAAVTVVGVVTLVGGCGGGVAVVVAGVAFVFLESVFVV